MVVDALLLCFCEDCQINDGSAERPYYMNSSLMVTKQSFHCRTQEDNYCCQLGSVTIHLSVCKLMDRIII